MVKKYKKHRAKWTWTCKTSLFYSTRDMFWRTLSGSMNRKVGSNFMCSWCLGIGKHKKLATILAVWPKKVNALISNQLKQFMNLKNYERYQKLGWPKQFTTYLIKSFTFPIVLILDCFPIYAKCTCISTSFFQLNTSFQLLIHKTLLGQTIHRSAK